jgi:hypothetical protein
MESAEQRLAMTLAKPEYAQELRDEVHAAGRTRIMGRGVTTECPGGDLPLS